MKILFITATRLGDAVLSTGLLDYMAKTWPDGKVTVACGWLPETIFEGFFNVEAVLPMRKQSMHRHWIKLWRQVTSTNWDMVVDIRNSVVSRLIRAKRRHIFGRHIDKRQHKVEQMSAVMGLSEVPAPKIYFTPTQNEKAQQRVPDGDPVLAVGPSASWIGKTWPAENFIQLIKTITGPGGVMEGARVAVLAAPGEEGQAQPVLDSIPSERRIDGIAKGSPGDVAAVMARCHLYVGNDSGLMHCAAAAGVPTVGLFGPSYPHLYRPWGDHTTYIRTPETFDELIDFKGYNSKTLDYTLMTSLTIENVINCVNEFSRSGLRNRLHNHVA